MKSVHYIFFVLFLIVIVISSVESQENKPPKFYYSGKTLILDKGGVFKDYIHVTDPNLFIKNVHEELYLKSMNQENIEIEPDTIKGPFVDDGGNPDQDTLRQVELRCNNVNWNHDENYISTIKILVSDKQGQWDQISFPVRLVDPVKWKCKMLVQNPKVTKFELVFGQGDSATTGSGNDAYPVGNLDIRYAETQLLPIDSINGFDARWLIPSTNGTLWNIQPISNYIEFKARTIDLTTQSDKDTVTFKWYRYDIPDPTDVVRNPKCLDWFICDGETGGEKFRYNMRTLTQYANSPGISEMSNNNNIAELTTFGAGYNVLIKGEIPGNRVEEIILENNLYVYPNPSSDKISVNLIKDKSWPEEIVIIDRLGKQLVKYNRNSIQSTGGNLSINIESFASGIYLIYAKYQDKISTVSFVKY